MVTWHQMRISYAYTSHKYKKKPTLHFTHWRKLRTEKYHCGTKIKDESKMRKSNLLTVLFNKKVTCDIIRGNSSCVCITTWATLLNMNRNLNVPFQKFSSRCRAAKPAYFSRSYVPSVVAIPVNPSLNRSWLWAFNSIKLNVPRAAFTTGVLSKWRMKLDSQYGVVSRFVVCDGLQLAVFSSAGPVHPWIVLPRSNAATCLLNKRDNLYNTFNIN